METEEKNLLEPYEMQIDINERKEYIAPVIVTLRNSKKLSMRKVAQIIDVPIATYSGYEKGKTEPPVEVLVRLSYLYDISIDFIVQRNTLIKSQKDAMVTVLKYAQQIEEMKKEMEENPNLKEQMQPLVDAMEKLTEGMKNTSMEVKF